MKWKQPQKLRWRLARTMIAMAALLWIGFVLLIHSTRLNELEQSASLDYQRIRSSFRLDALPAYQENRANGLEERADHILMSHLSSLSLDGIREMDGGVALAVRMGENLVRSQITWGRGNEAGSGQEWYLYFDQGLDDQGQIEFAKRMIEGRKGWAYEIDSLGKEMEEGTFGDGTVARVCGRALPGGAVEVQGIDLVHPDGTREQILRPQSGVQPDLVLELEQMRIESVLLPSWSSDGRDGPIQMEKRLASFREAQAIIDRGRAGERRSVQRDWGRLSSGVDPEGFGYWLSASCDLRGHVMKEQWALYLVSLGFAAAVLLILSARLSQKVTEPVEELSQSANQGRCREDGPVTELNTLAAAFNSAQDQLEKQLKREREFTRAAAHELKTPLAILRSHAEALREDIAPEKRGQYLDIVLDESDRMAKLVGRLLELSRLESGAPLKKEHLELSALIQEVWLPLALQMEQKKITLDMNAAELWMEGDRERLREAAENLASNAVRYCAVGGRIRVELELREGEIRMSIYNDGLQIPEEQLSRLWEPFYRGDSSHSRESGGTGLGLAIVRAAVEAHGGWCRAENREGGVCFLMAVPAAGDQSGQAAESAAGER